MNREGGREKEIKGENRQNKFGENRNKTGKNKFPNIVYCYPKRYKNMYHLYKTKMTKRIFRKQNKKILWKLK